MVWGWVALVRTWNYHLMSALGCPLVILTNEQSNHQLNQHEVHLTNMGTQVYGLWVWAWSVTQKCCSGKKRVLGTMVFCRYTWLRNQPLHCLDRCSSHREERTTHFSKKKKTNITMTTWLGSVAGPVIQDTGRSEFEDGLGSGDFVSGYSYHMSVRTRLSNHTKQTKF
jgi:hypothetical protein